MTALSYSTQSVMAYALIAYRTSHERSLTYWQAHSTDPFSKEVAAAYISELENIDRAMQEFQAVAPPPLNGFLQQQIDLIYPATTTSQPPTQGTA